MCAIFFFIPFIMDKITPSLHKKMLDSSKNKKISIIVHLQSQTEKYLSNPCLSPKAKVESLKIIAQREQSLILSELKEKFDESKFVLHKSYWIFNGFFCSATPEVIKYLAKHEKVKYITDDRFIFHHNFVKEKVTDQGKSAGLFPGWNIQWINAPLLWKMGITGKGVVVGILDSGIWPNNVLFQNRIRKKYGWYDAVNGKPDPYDDDVVAGPPPLYHGTFVAGIVAAGLFSDKPNVGVAPECSLVVVKVLDEEGRGKISDHHDAFQWLASLILIDKAPDIINCSWVDSVANSTEFWEDIYNLKCLGIYTVGAVGNIPDAPGIKALPPGNFPCAIGVGATYNSDGDVDRYSSISRIGPAPDEWPWNAPCFWPIPTWNRTSPDVTAPGGVKITSACTDETTYVGAKFSATSWATPHVTGICALIIQAFPDIKFTELYRKIINGVERPIWHAPYPNSKLGYGRVDAFKALLDFSFPVSHSTALNGISADVGDELQFFTLSEDYLGRLITESRHIVNGQYFWNGEVNGGVHNNLAPGLYLIKNKTKDKLYQVMMYSDITPPNISNVNVSGNKIIYSISAADFLDKFCYVSICKTDLDGKFVCFEQKEVLKSFGSYEETLSQGVYQWEKIHIIARDNAGNVDIKSVTGNKPLEAPTLLSAQPISEDKVQLSWRDNSTYETGFKIEVLGGIYTKWTEIASVQRNITSCIVNNLEFNTIYQFRVKGYVKGKFYEFFSNYSNIATCEMNILNTPTNLTANSIDYHIVHLNWQDNSNYETGCEIEYKKISESTWHTGGTVGQNQEEFTLTGLEPLTLYEFRVRAYDDEGHYSDWSNIAYAWTISLPLSQDGLLYNNGRKMEIFGDTVYFVFTKNDSVWLGKTSNGVEFDLEK